MAEPLCKELKRKLERAEGGDLAAARQVDQAEQSAPETAQGVEQEAADGPKGRGFAR